MEASEKDTKMKYALTASITVIVICLLVIGYLTLHMAHGTISCTWKSTFNPVDAVGLEAINDLPEQATEPLPTPNHGSQGGIHLNGKNPTR